MLVSVRSALPPDARWWIWTCVVGVGLGFFGLLYVPFLKRRRARLAAVHAASHPQPQLSPESVSGDSVSRDSGSNTVSSTETPGKSTMS